MVVLALVMAYILTPDNVKTRVASLGLEVHEPSEVYAIASHGWNVRAYVITPKENPDWRCMFGYGDNKGAGGCYPVAKVKENENVK